MADRKAFDAIFGKQSALTPDPLARPDSPTARFLAERYAVGDAPTASGYYGDYRTDPENKVEERGIILPGAKYSDGKIHPAWPAIVHDAWQGMKAFESADPTDNSPEATARLSKAAFDAAGLAMTGSLAVPRPSNAVGTFGGKLAKTADHAKLAEAEKMAAAGADRQSIWDATGWFQGPDQKWRYEISDHVDYPTGEGAAYRPGKLKSEILDQGASREGLEKSGYQGRLNEVLAHKELFDAYPDLAKSTWASVPPDKMALPGMGGVWRGQQLGMQVNSDIAPSLVRGRSITLHEIQHGLQDAEGFTRGSNPEMFKHDIGQLQSTLSAIEDARFLKEQATKRGMTPDEVVPIIEDLYGRKVGLDGYKKFVGYDEGKLSQWADTHRKLLNDAADPSKAYHRTAGEVEARAVQKRMDLTPEQRQARPPWLDYDVPEKDQIVRFGNSGPQQSAGDFLKERYGSSTSTALGGDGAITLPPMRPEKQANRQIEQVWGPKWDILMGQQYRMAEAGGDYSTMYDILAAKLSKASGIDPDMRAAMQQKVRELYNDMGPEGRAAAGIAESNALAHPTVDRTAASTPPSGSLNQTTSPQDFLRERYGSDVYSNPKESAALPSAVKALENRALPMDRESQLARAREMGFDTENRYYVSALQPVEAFSKHGKFMGHKGVSGVSVSDNPEMASRYLDRYGEFDYKGKPFAKNMMEVYIKPGNVEEFSKPIYSGVPMGAPLPKDYKWPRNLDGIDTLSFPDRITKRGDVSHLPADTLRPHMDGRELILRDPTQIRSVNATFDPAQSHSSNLLASNPKTSAAVPVGVKAVEGQQMKAYPLAPRSEWYGEANFEATGGKMRMMSPDEFLKNARPLEIDDVSRENIDLLKAHMQDGRTLDPLQLYPGGKEDGRHRAYAARELGIKQVPVIVFDLAKQGLGRAVKN